MGKHRGNWVWPGAAVLGVAIIAAACSSSSSTTTTTSASSSTTPSSTTATTAGSGNTNGVTSTAINVGAISTLTGSIASDFDGLSPGIKAYFDMVNAEGGINGRKLNLAYNLDDGGQPSQFTQLTHTLIDQDKAFAVMVASYWFTPNYFVETNTPTYGYNVSGNWSPAPNLFAAGGSVQNYSAGVPAYAYVMNKTKSKSIAIISYGPAITSSYDACNTTGTDLSKAGFNVSYEDLGAQLGGSYSSAVQRMQQAGSQFVVSCMQESDNITMARAIQQYGLKIHQLWLSGYDQTLLDQYSDLMQGVYFNLSGNVPYEAAGAGFGNTYPGMQQYLKAMNKYEPKFTYNGTALQGWQSAALLAQAVKQAGNNLTQSNIINITNHITNFTAGGLTTVTNWENSHTKTTYPTCSAFVQVKGKKFVSVYGKGKQVFVCVGPSASNTSPVAAPAGTPGT
jgi:branched-chain amino acid transport system substrate-binding protein